MAGHHTGYPSVFNLDGEEFMIGSEVGIFLNMIRGALYKKYPSMKRRTATPEERKRIIDILPQNSHAYSSCIILLKSDEVMEIIKGLGDRYKRDSFLNILKETTTVLKNEDNLITETEISVDIPLIDPKFEPTQPVIRSIGEKQIKTFPLFHFPGSICTEERIIPIILDISVDDVVLRDFFTWNIYDNDITIEMFAKLLCDDFDLPTRYFVPRIVSSMNEQIESFINIKDSVFEKERRVVIKLDIEMYGVCLKDQFEWDLSSRNITPENFAVILVKELGLSLDFIPRIAVDIRCQIEWYRYVYTLNEWNYLSLVEFPPLRDPDSLDLWTPSITEKYLKTSLNYKIS